MNKTFRRTFLTGLFIVLPVLVTVWVIQLLFGQIDSALTPAIRHVLRLLGVSEWTELAWVNWVSPLVSLAVAVVFIWLVGLVGGNVLGKRVIKGLEQLVLQVPVVRGIYSATRQFVDTFSATQGNAFSRVVLVEYPRREMWTIGLVTNESTGDIRALTKQQVVAVFVPTTPNPTSGFLLYVPETQLIGLSMSVDDALKMIISVGVLAPPNSPSAAPAVATG